MIFFLLESDSNATPRVSENCQLHYDYGSDPKTNENSISGGGVWDQYSTQWKSEEEGGLYPGNKDGGRLLF